MSRARWAALAALAPALALGHAKGFHKKVVLTVSREGVDALLAMDVDGSDRTVLLRQGADADRSGELSKEEAAALKAKLVELLERNTVVTVSGYRLAFEDVDAKIDLRGDRRVSDTGVSVAVLRRARWPGPPGAGMKLSVVDESPDQSPVAVEVHRAAEDGGDAVTAAQLERGQAVTVRLERMW